MLNPCGFFVEGGVPGTGSGHGRGRGEEQRRKAQWLSLGRPTEKGRDYIGEERERELWLDLSDLLVGHSLKKKDLAGHFNLGFIIHWVRYLA